MPLFRRTHHTSTAHSTTRSTRTRRSYNPFGRRRGGNGRSHRQNRIAGLKAARSNPHTSSSASHAAGTKLHSMGAKKNHVPLSVRVKRALHIGAHSRRSTTRTNRTSGGGVFGGRRRRMA